MSYGKFCSHCNSPMLPGDRFCLKCGKEYGDNVFVPSDEPIGVYGIETFTTYVCRRCHISWSQSTRGKTDRYCPQCGKRCSKSIRPWLYF